jgi:hypothetical protein
MSQPPDDHLKALWQGQHTETEPMSVDAIRLRADAYRNRTRQRYRAALAIWALETVFFAALAWTARNAVIRTGDLMMIAALGWMIWRTRHRWPGQLPDERTSAAALIDFHRDELLRQKFRISTTLITLAPALLALAVMLVGMRSGETAPSLAHWAPLVALTAAWVVALWWLVRRQQRTWRRQLDEVDATRLE